MDRQENGDFYLQTLRQLVSQPTAPFHEEYVCSYIRQFLEQHHLPYMVDPYGNIIAHYRNGPAARPLVLMAHTDHPAFELHEPLTTPDPNHPQANWTARLAGGVGVNWLQQPAPLKIFRGNNRDRPVAATLSGSRVTGGPRDITLYLQVEESAGLEPGNFGIWDLPDFELRGDFIHARVIDDLAGCAAGMLALWQLSRQEAAANVYGVFTRAEEVGLVGAELIFQQGLLPPETYIFSLEASRTLPGAVQGEGPVIRVGDRAFTFSEEAEFVLKLAAERLQAAADGPVKVQRQLMSGGRCEASAAIMAGYTASGLAFPLGNYHNMGEDNRLQPENIHRQDFLTGVELLVEAARLMPQLERYIAERRERESTPAALIERLLQTRSKF